MALAATILWEVRTTGAQTNGGGFKPGASGVDYSQQDAAQYALSGVTTAGADDTLLSASAAADMVGNTCRIVSGTNFTAGWYEIIAVVVGVSIQLDRTCASAAGAAGVVNVGGAFLIGGTLDDDFCEALVGGNSVYIKVGTYTLGEVIAVASSSATGTNSIKLIGYNTTRTDEPTGANRPLITGGASNNITTAGNWRMRNLIITGTGANILLLGADNRLFNCKVINSSSTVSRNALVLNAAGCRVINCEVISQNGIGISSGQTNQFIWGCTVHDSDIGISLTSAGYMVCFNVIWDCKTAAISSSTSAWRSFIANNTIHGANTTPIGIGVRTTAATTGTLEIINNIFSGLATGIEIGTVLQDSVVEDFNTFFNCTTPLTNCAAGLNSLTTDPAFTAVTQLTGSDGTAAPSGTTLTSASADFSTVTDNVDYVRVVSGSGSGSATVTAGIYLITGHTGTALTLNNAVMSAGTGTGSSIVYVVYPATNFLPTGDI